MTRMAEMQDVRAAFQVDDLTLSDGAVIRLRRHGIPSGPRVVLSHGNGLAIQGYAVFWELLCADCDVILFDMRNHGMNPTDDLSRHSWLRFVADLGEIWDAIDGLYGVKPMIGVFHSLSAVVSLQHLLAHGPRCDGLLLFDPPVFPRAGHALEPLQSEHMRDMADRATRRPVSYSAPSALAAQFKRRATLWVEGAHLDMAQATLHPVADGSSWTLSCPREYEAHVFASNTDSTLWPALMAPVPLPIRIVGADPDLPGQLPPALICRALCGETGIDYISIPGTTHFLQLEEPAMCRDEVIRLLDRIRNTAA